jgi:hypothetical protein
VALADEGCGGALADRFELERRPVHVVFYPGPVGSELCRSMYAGTKLNGTVVLVCVAKFGTLGTGKFARNILIHEVLHTIGLKESPAHSDALTSLEISSIVRETCK